jgi:hypothetical protein
LKIKNERDVLIEIIHAALPIDFTVEVEPITGVHDVYFKVDETRLVEKVTTLLQPALNAICCHFENLALDKDGSLTTEWFEANAGEDADAAYEAKRDEEFNHEG